jgi:hypothetical protein
VRAGSSGWRPSSASPNLEARLAFEQGAQSCPLNCGVCQYNANSFIETIRSVWMCPLARQFDSQSATALLRFGFEHALRESPARTYRLTRGPTRCTSKPFPSSSIVNGVV